MKINDVGQRLQQRGGRRSGPFFFGGDCLGPDVLLHLSKPVQPVAVAGLPYVESKIDIFLKQSPHFCPVGLRKKVGAMVGRPYGDCLIEDRLASCIEMRRGQTERESENEAEHAQKASDQGFCGFHRFRMRHPASPFAKPETTFKTKQSRCNSDSEQSEKKGDECGRHTNWI